MPKIQLYYMTDRSDFSMLETSMLYRYGIGGGGGVKGEGIT